MDGAIAKVILSQTMTTQDGSSLAQAKVHGGVKQELIIADADLLTDSFTAGPARWFTDLNFGTDVAAPIVIRQVEEEADLAATAKTDETLSRLGYSRTKESFKDIYGDGFERVEKNLGSDELPGSEGARDRTEGKGNIVPFRKEASFAEPAPASPDVVDRIVADLLATEAAGFGPIVQLLVDRLAAAASPEEVDAILAEAAQLDTDAAAIARLERAGAALRLAAAAGRNGASA